MGRCSGKVKESVLYYKVVDIKVRKMNTKTCILSSIKIFVFSSCSALDDVRREKLLLLILARLATIMIGNHGNGKLMVLLKAVSAHS